jgi:hypothetical protein
MTSFNAPRTRAVLAASALLASALAASQAGAAAKAPDFAPRLRVEANRYDPVHPAWLTIDVTQGNTERKLARMSFVVPKGYALPKVPRGRRFAHAIVGVKKTGKQSLLPALLLTGDLKAAKTVGNSCVAKPVAVYTAVLATDSGGSTKASMGLTVFVEKVGDSHRFTLCLPATSPVAGTEIRRVGLEIISGLYPPGPGRPMWRGLFTPVASSADAAKRQTTESQGIVPLPSYLTIAPAGKATVAPGTVVRSTGTLSLNGPPGVRKVRISLISDPSGAHSIGVAKTTKNGRFTFRMKAPTTAGRYYFQARALSKNVKCMAASSEAPRGCTSATLAGISSAPFKIVVTKG